MKQIYLFFLASSCLLNVGSFSDLPGRNTKTETLQWIGKAAYNSYSLKGTVDVKSVRSRASSERIEDLYVEIDMTSLDHENKELRSHLRSTDFFEVKTFKTASFTLSEPALIENNQATLIGMMQIKNIRKKETFVVNVKEDQLVIDLSINRTNYGITFNSPTFFEKLKDQAIADEFILKGSIDLH
jgi:hypothetical protein